MRDGSDMGHFKSDLRDIEFNVFEFGGADAYFGSGPFAEMDVDTAKAIIREIDRLAREEFAASFADADRHPPKLGPDGEVHLPESLKASIRAFYDGDWDRLALPPELGGFNAPPSLLLVAEELLVGANPAAYFYTIGSLMARILAEEGTEEQIRRFAIPMVERHWGGTMVLTEPDAGSDVGAGRTKAIPVDEENGVYHIEGVKRFITSGEHDAAENIIHLVLARPPGARPGTKGLSMFIVPKFLVNEDGSLGPRNGVRCTKVEDKMGIKGSVTCELTFGLDEPAVGYLVGNVHDGIRQMFRVIEHARMLIGTKAMSTLSTAYLNSLEYAQERIQGPDLTQARDPEAPRVPIIRHPDVRRLLMLCRSHTHAMRALTYYAAWAQDRSLLEPEDPYWERLHDLLLPLVKGWNSEKAFELLAQALQVLGGSGFTQDYPHEQYIRDAKIDTIYEGTTAIQALDLFFRKIARDQGQTIGRLAGEIAEFVKGGGEGDDVFAEERKRLGIALDDVQAQLGVLIGHLMASAQNPPEIYKAGLHTNHLLESVAELTAAWLLLRQAELAQRRIDEGSDDPYYLGKVETARFFVRHALPKAAMRRRWAEEEDGSLMTLPVEAF